jgi:hypothetical protein
MTRFGMWHENPSGAGRVITDTPRRTA